MYRRIKIINEGYWTHKLIANISSENVSKCRRHCHHRYHRYEQGHSWTTKQELLCGYIERFIESGSNCQGFLWRWDCFDPNNRNKWMKYKEQAKPCRKFLIHTRCWVNNSEILLILKQEWRNRENSERLLKIRDFDPYPSACDD